MGSRVATFAVILGVVAVGALEVALLSRDTSIGSAPASNDQETWTDDPNETALDNRRAALPADRKEAAIADRLEFIDTAAGFAAGEMRRVTLVKTDPARIVLDFPKPKGYPREGTWTSPQVKTDIKFTEFLPCWNACTPANTGVAFHAGTRDAGSQEWTPWLRVGGWGRTTTKRRLDTCPLGFVDEDTLKLNRPADMYQVRATLQSFDLDTAVNPSIRRIAVTYSGPADRSTVPAPVYPGPPEKWARSLDVPYIPQGDNADPVTGMTCSPTSTSMVLQFWGVDRPTMENCLAIWDDHNALFGNWANATQRAGELGMDAWLQRFRNWDQVKLMIAAGQPIVASIKYEKGTLAGSPIAELAEWESGGHLLVIRGFTPDGNPIVNDPGHRKLGKGLVMSAKGLAHAWFDHGGVGYVIHPPAKPIPQALIASSARRPTTMPTTAPLASSAAK